ncbi:MAG: F0F1 ATP synthase subunit epsilon [Gemmatimonas sp.]
MADKVTFELVSPEKLLFSADVDMVVVPGTEGDFGILPGHAPFISTVRAGVLDVYEGGINPTNLKTRIFVAGGFAETADSRLTVLAEEAVPVADLDRARVEARLADARSKLQDADSEDAKSQAARAVAVAEAMLVAAT